MPTTGCCYSAIDICASQINRNDCDGNVLTGEDNVVVTCAAVDINVEPIEGENNGPQRDPNGSGGYCAERSSNSTVEGQEVELTLCSRTDAALMEIIGIWDLVYDENGNCVGVKAKCCQQEECQCDPGDDVQCSNPGVSIILWHTAWLGKKRHPTHKWVGQVLPNVVFDPASVSVQRNSEFNTYTVTGRAECNENYGQGPGDFYPDPNGLDSCWSEVLTNTRPDGMCDCDLCGYATDGYVGAA